MKQSNVVRIADRCSICLRPRRAKNRCAGCKFENAAIRNYAAQVAHRVLRLEETPFHWRQVIEEEATSMGMLSPGAVPITSLSQILADLAAEEAEASSASSSEQNGATTRPTETALDNRPSTHKMIRRPT
jgi:hypothetical protein